MWERIDRLAVTSAPVVRSEQRRTDAMRRVGDDARYVDALLEERLVLFGASRVEDAVSVWRRVLEIAPSEPRATDYIESAGYSVAELWPAEARLITEPFGSPEAAGSTRVETVSPAGLDPVSTAAPRPNRRFSTVLVCPRRGRRWRARGGRDVEPGARRGPATRGGGTDAGGNDDRRRTVGPRLRRGARSPPRVARPHPSRRVRRRRGEGDPSAGYAVL